MHKSAPDIKSSVQEYQCSQRSDIFWIAALIWVVGKVLYNKKIFIATLLLKKIMAGVYTEKAFNPLT